MDLPKPHSLTQVRPHVTPDASNASVFDWKTAPVFSKAIKGLFQTRSGRYVGTEEGQGYSYDAVFYTQVSDVLNQDVLKVNLPGVVGNFRVVGVEAKYDNDGKWNHHKVALTRDSAVIV